MIALLMNYRIHNESICSAGALRSVCSFAHMQRALREVENVCGAQRRCGLMADVYATEQTTLNAVATFHEGGQSNRWFDAKALGSMVAGKSDSNVARRTELRGTRQ
jgi:hypothetical protein